MGQPRQEKWAHRLREELGCAAVLNLGASMAFAIGARKRGPSWATGRGLEWLFRVLAEPRKMFARYFVEIPWLVLCALRRR
jgi:N-acetylglucosaminyldiphosphoundecaprenol N-acetyl-beta-D-mannosaminyltransferase